MGVGWRFVSELCGAVYTRFVVVVRHDGACEKRVYGCTSIKTTKGKQTKTREKSPMHTQTCNEASAECSQSDRTSLNWPCVSCAPDPALCTLAHRQPTHA